MAESKGVSEAVEIAQQELEYRVELFNKSQTMRSNQTKTSVCRMVSSCYNKCVDKRMKDQSLSVGENSCIDRCASKYWQVGMTSSNFRKACHALGCCNCWSVAVWSEATNIARTVSSPLVSLRTLHMLCRDSLLP